jgi:hypothetical protein
MNSNCQGYICDKHLSMLNTEKNSFENSQMNVFYSPILGEDEGLLGGVQITEASRQEVAPPWLRTTSSDQERRSSDL